MRLVIADDDQLFQSTVASILNRYPKDYEIAAQIYDGETAAAKTCLLYTSDAADD